MHNDEEEPKTEAVNQCSPDPSYRNLRRARAKDYRGVYDPENDQWSPSFEGDERGYVVIAECKDDEPIVYETYIGRSSYEDAHKRMEEISGNKSIIRCAVAKLVYVSGHHGLIDNRRS